MLDGGSDVGLDAVGSCLVDVGHVVEVLAALAHACRPPEVVDRYRRDSSLGEAERELFVEAIEPADVGQDDDAVAAWLFRLGREGGEPVSVGRLEGQVLMPDGAALDGRNRRQRVELEAHAGDLTCSRRWLRSKGGPATRT